jgi:iron complex transport system substrate-binding protein
MNKTWRVLTAAVIALGIAAGCAVPPKSATPPPKPAASAPTPAPAENFVSFAPATVTVTDSWGRTVQVPQNPGRIACLYAFTNHVATLLNMGPNIVACVEGVKRDKLLTAMVPSLLEALVPISTDKINIEELIKADPDVIFIREDTAQDARETEQLDKTGIPYLVINDVTMAQQKQAIAIIGKALGQEKEAQDYLNYYDDCMDRVAAVTDKIPQNEKVRVFHSVNEATRTDYRDTLAAEWSKAAGVVNVSVEAELRFASGKYFANLEQIYLWDPDVILAHEDSAIGYITANEQWAALQAVKDKKVYKMPNGVSRWGHPGSLETPLAILWTAKTLYPEHFKTLDMAAETKAFYKEFFEIDLDDDIVTDILAGNGMRLPKAS